jgi:hypothetical protein
MAVDSEINVATNHLRHAARPAKMDLVAIHGRQI